jgi:hypothetical protein
MPARLAVVQLTSVHLSRVSTAVTRHHKIATVLR